MLALFLCVLSFGVTFWAGKRSLGQGLISLLFFGYFYGILRANLLTTFSHFIFDAGLIGLFLSQDWISSDPSEARRLEAVRFWTLILIAWPTLMLVMPFQPFLISVVGLRAQIFFLPIILLGSRLKESDLVQLFTGLAVLNLIAAGFAVAEYRTSVAQFYPVSPVTQIIHASGDVAGGFFRIPAIFTSAHAYGGTMVSSLPYLIGGWDRAINRRSQILAVIGIGAALLGVLMSATRQNFVIGLVMVLVTIFNRRVTARNRAVFLALIAVFVGVALNNERFQRFKSLSDTDAVVERISGSVNRNFWELLAEHPMGNGLGGGGSSIPYFLQGQVRNPIGMENSYTMILCEQGVIGLLIFLGFVAWYMSRAGVLFAKGPWASGRRMAWSLVAFGLATAWLGIGMFTSIPGTVMLLLSLGWTSTSMVPEASRLRQTSRPKSLLRQARYGTTCAV